MTAPVDSFQRIPYHPATDGRVEMHSGLSRHYPTLHANLVARPGHSREVGVLMAHPASNFLTHFLLRALAEAGVPAMGLNTRYTANEPALIMERAATDLGAGVRWMRERLGFEKVVLLGFSGGGPLSSFYQAQAESPTVTHTPAGDPADLAAEHLLPADGLMLVGAHAGRARVLRHWIDPSVTDESDPFATDPQWDLYAAGRTAPLDRDWVQGYRAAQLARIDRIDDWARAELDRVARLGAADRAFVVHRTVADPRFVDVTLDPGDRTPGCMYGDPRQANSAAGGLARFATARSWLSTWSYRQTNADALRNLPSVTVPVLVAPLMADQAAFPSESREMFDAARAAKRDHLEFAGLNHYLVDQPQGPQTIATALRDWLTGTGLLGR
ncbi:alpha/beta hydrolase [Rhodococcus sp. D2-41]|uniref:Alpha/beta hydrolase n=1 Tax=Speluncibacter jeojiensis TaxID=2710754 RepID=A0A9X4RE59_9ACTN|nr:alpha/beta hydrolase [Rhodococcus sp. D2-41]MDG3012588.1 alpha/beta hydrolase [Rhodococcus sp. D2-41]MDG3015293.1 alpha/beta hydrolase [Corynebacteriales bacterium D3-21]